jgi:putative transcriptional regulator
LKNNLPEIREKFSYTQEKLAQKMKTSRQTVISIEKGRYDPSLSLAIRISRHFNMKVEDIFFLEEEENE